MSSFFPAQFGDFGGIPGTQSPRSLKALCLVVHLLCPLTCVPHDLGFYPPCNNQSSVHVSMHLCSFLLPVSLQNKENQGLEHWGSVRPHMARLCVLSLVHPCAHRLGTGPETGTVSGQASRPVGALEMCGPQQHPLLPADQGDSPRPTAD